MIRILDKPPAIIGLPSKPRGLAVRYRTSVCDAKGRVERHLQEGWNMITDFGMDSLGTTLLHLLVTHLNLSSATQTLKRTPSAGNELTVDSTGGAGTLLVSCTANFFEAGDVGRTLKITGWPELLVTAYTDQQNITATARAAEWLPGFTPDTDPHDGDWGVHYTNTATLQTEFTRFGSPTASYCYNDSANSRWGHKRIWLSAQVVGSPWTVNQLGWSANSANCFGKANLAAPDVIAVDKRYQVELDIFSVLTPINLTGVVLDFGGTVGSHTCDIRMERIMIEGQAFAGTAGGHFLMPPVYTVGSDSINRPSALTSAVTIQSTLWQDDPGYYPVLAAESSTGYRGNYLAGASYVSGSHYLRHDLQWPETITIPAATALTWMSLTPFASLNRHLIIRPQSGTITKPSGWRIEARFPIRWTRELTN